MFGLGLRSSNPEKILGRIDSALTFLERPFLHCNLRL
jgi:hypothetical protein